MPEHIRCRDCEVVVFGFTVPELRPVGAEECPNCGGAEFERLE